MKVAVTSHFLKRVRRLSSKEKELLDQKTLLFQDNPRNIKLKNHPLSGKLKGYFSFSVTRSKRVKYIIVDIDKALFVDVGSHEDVY